MKPDIESVLDAASQPTLGLAATSHAAVERDGWHEIGQPGEIPFAAGWSAVGFTNAVFYTKNDRGWVHVEGRVAGNPMTNPLIFTLPEGYRPTEPVRFVVGDTDLFTQLETVVVDLDGGVRCLGHAGAAIDFDFGWQFRFVGDQPLPPILGA